MKAKTIVGLMACAVLVPAFADIDNNKPTTNDWFSTSVPDSTIVASGAAWATGDAVTPPTVDAAAHVMVIDADVGAPATLTPTNINNKTVADLASDGLVTITSSAYLAPSAKTDLPAATDLGNAQVGFAVATETVSETPTTNFYAYVRKAPSGNTSNGEWIAVSNTVVTVPSEVEDTNFKIELDYRSTPNVAKFYVKVGENYVQLSGTPYGGTATNAFEFVPAESKLSDVAAIGSGTITSIDAKFENAVAVGKDNKPYGTIAEAYNSTGSGTVVAWDSTTGAAATGAAVYAANGLDKAVCMALNIDTADANAKIALRPAATQVANKITLATAVAPVNDVTVMFSVTTVSGTDAGNESYPADGIQLPQGTGTYRVVPVVNPAVVTP